MWCGRWSCIRIWRRRHVTLYDWLVDKKKLCFWFILCLYKGRLNHPSGGRARLQPGTRERGSRHWSQCGCPVIYTVMLWRRVRHLCEVKSQLGLILLSPHRSFGRALIACNSFLILKYQTCVKGKGLILHASGRMRDTHRENQGQNIFNDKWKYNQWCSRTVARFN